jgi:hypothetical protein
MLYPHMANNSHGRRRRGPGRGRGPALPRYRRPEDRRQMERILDFHRMGRGEDLLKMEGALILGRRVRKGFG